MHSKEPGTLGATMGPPAAGQPAGGKARSRRSAISELAVATAGSAVGNPMHPPFLGSGPGWPTCRHAVGCGAAGGGNDQPIRLR